MLALIVLMAASCHNNYTASLAPQPMQIVPPVVSAPSPTPKQPVRYETLSGKKPQFVVMAFDGSYSLNMWQQTLDFSQQMAANNHPVHFTYFLSGVYFLNYRKAAKYQPPQMPAGKSEIGFADSNLDVEKRVAYVNRAINEGHEIGSHANGHFDGSDWSPEDWQQELDQFSNLIFHIDRNNDVSAVDAQRYRINITPGELIGFRAPALGRSESLFKALKNNGYLYDTSSVGQATAWPKKLDNGLWEFPLAQIKYANTDKNLLSMDYNFYYKQSRAKDITKQGDPQWAQFYQDTYSSYMNYFDNNYNANRAPVFIGSHFSNWNDGVYWAAMKDFAATVCVKPEVFCVDNKELLNYLNTETLK